MAEEELIQYITYGREERYLEYKGPINWNDPQTKAKITKTVLAMSNLQDGGVIVIGVKQKGENFTPVGLDSEILSSFKQDDISVHVNNYADPFADIKVSHQPYNNMNFVIIQISPFLELPVICKKDGENKLRKGAIYIRPRKKFESVEVPSQVEMREILNISTEKIIRNFKRKLLMTGIIIEEPEKEAKQKFDSQLNGL
jgi:hypothetical protein